MAEPRSVGGGHNGWARSAIAAVVLGCLLIVGSVAGPLRPPSAQAVSAAELRQRLEDTRAGFAKIQANIKKADAVKQSAMKDVAALDQYIQATEQDVQDAVDARDAAVKELAAIRSNLADVNKALKSKTDELAKTELDLEAQRGWLDYRVGSVYKSGGQLAYLAAFLKPESISQFLGRIDMMSAILAQDNKVIAQIGALKVTVAAEKQALEAEQAQVDAFDHIYNTERPHQGLPGRLGSAGMGEAALDHVAEPR